jgi:hypothetical protein
MRILLDTNIIIPLEDSSKALDDSFASLIRIANENNNILLTHPASLDDIKRDTNEARKVSSISRISKYSSLESPPIPSPKVINELGLKETNENDKVDNIILYAVYKNAVNILVTEDRELHKKARDLQISDRVHYLQQHVEFLNRLYAREPISLPNIIELNLYQIDLNQPFFNSLRADYVDFNKWYEKASQEGRKAWVYKTKAEKVDAVCIFDEQKNPILTDDHRSLPGNTLKLCTFKVGEDVRGKKIGELFLKAAFKYAYDNRIENLFIHMKPYKQGFLKDLCVNFGFLEFGKYKGDLVYVKKHPLIPPNSLDEPVEYNRRYFPHFKNESRVGKFIIPIIPQYHRILFPDIQDQLDIFHHFSIDSSKQIVGNAIKQAYLCHAPVKGMKSGDIIMFYRSHDKKAVTSLGIVEISDDFDNTDEIVQLVSKRTVYSFEEIEKMAEKKTKVILFRLALHFTKTIPFKWLTDNEIVKGNIQTIRRISNESFKKITEKYSVENCFHAD